MGTSADTTFTISGMSCGGCVRSLTRVLSATPGLEPLQVDVGRATVRIDPQLASVEAARAAIARAGFTVTAEA